MNDLAFNPSIHEYRLGGRVVPHISEIIAPLQPVSFFTVEARDRGSRVHAVVAGELPASRLQQGETGYLEAWHRFRDQFDYLPLMQEEPLGHPSGWAGTPDQYGVLNGEHAVFEIKTGAHHPSYAIQTAAQAELIKVVVHPSCRPKRRFALCLGPDGRYKLHPHRCATDYGVFQALLNVYRFRKIHNIS